ncbi:hypothetical protein GCM10020001_035090 [Nonomuraea salmonea]
MRDRLGQRPGGQRGELTGPNPVDRGKKGSKIHLITERSGLPLAVAISAANVHDSLALEPLVRSIPPIRSRHGPRRRRPGKLHGDKGYDYPHLRAFLRGRGIIPPASPGAELSPVNVWDAIAGWWSERFRGWPATAAYTAAMNAGPPTSRPSPPSPQPSSATADSPNESSS